MVKALSAKVGSATRKLVLVKLADNANDEGGCWPSIAHIASECEMSERSVHTHLRALIKLGFIVKESRYVDNRQCSNFYRINIDEPEEGGVKNLQGEGEKSAPPGVKNLQTEPPIGTCHKNQGNQAGKPPSIPDQIWSVKPDFIPDDLWADFVNHRKAIKKPMTECAARRLASKLGKMQAAGVDAAEALSESIVNGWQGVFAPKDAGQTKTKPRKEL